MNTRTSFLHLSILFVLTFLLTNCSSDDPQPSVEAPESYAFTRNGQTTVSFSGQTDRINMATELINGMKDFDNATKQSLLEMFRNESESGDDVSPFADAGLNASTKSVKSKVAASKDLFSTNTTESSEIKADFEAWINAQVDEVFPNKETLAEAGVAGQVADGSSTRYVNADGLEYNQAVNKGLIGALMADQILNNYLSTAVLDEAENVANNDNEVLDGSSNYTTMEHKWDEAYGYLYGTSADATDPNNTIGSDDSFLNKYLGSVNSDDDFNTYAEEIFDAFKLGRAAIVAKNYTTRDAQVAIIRERISEVIAIRAVYYLQQGKTKLSATNGNSAAFHALSEAYGFIYSLRFTRKPEGSTSFFAKAEVDAMLGKLMGGTNGLWSVTGTALDEISADIAEKFSFTVEQAGS